MAARFSARHQVWFDGGITGLMQPIVKSLLAVRSQRDDATLPYVCLHLIALVPPHMPSQAAAALAVLTLRRPPMPSVVAAGIADGCSPHHATPQQRDDQPCLIPACTLSLWCRRSINRTRWVSGPVGS